MGKNPENWGHFLASVACFLLLPAGEEELPGTPGLHPKLMLLPRWYREPNKDDGGFGAVNGFRQTVTVPIRLVAEAFSGRKQMRYLYVPAAPGARVKFDRSLRTQNTIHRVVYGEQRIRRAFTKALRDFFSWPGEEVTLTGDGEYNFRFRTRSGYHDNGRLIGKRWPDARIVLTDINERAVELARRDLMANGVTNAQVVRGDGFGAVDGDFDLIALNPPVRAGRAVVYGLFSASAGRLTKDGALYVVMRKQHGAESAQRYLQILFTTVEHVARDKGYWVLSCKEPVQ